MTEDQGIEELLRRKERVVKEMRGVDKIAIQHSRGRMTARERIDALLNPGHRAYKAYLAE